jgi:hypothetical protein
VPENSRGPGGQATDPRFIIQPTERRLRLRPRARRGDVVRFADDGEAYEVMQIEHIATPQGTSHGMRYATIIVRLTACGRPADRGGS